MVEDKVEGISNKDIDSIIEKMIASACERNFEDTDYIKNGVRYCGKCNTPKEKLITYKGVSRICPVNCECKQKRIEEAIAKEEREKKIERMKRRRKEGFSDEDMIQWTFETDDNQNPGVTNAMLNYVNKFEEFKKMGYGLLLYGSVGTGKTFAAAEVVNALIDKGYCCLMTNFSRIINTMWSVEDKQAYLDDLNKYELLVIDDLSSERQTEYMKDMVFQIIDARYRANLPMIITTNVDASELQGDLVQTRVYNRLQERCLFLKVEASNKRVKRGIDNAKTARKLLGLE